MAIYRKVKGYVDAVADFTREKREGVTVNGELLATREVELAVPKGSMTHQQQLAIDRAINWAQTRNVVVRMVEIR